MANGRRGRAERVNGSRAGSIASRGRGGIAFHKDTPTFNTANGNTSLSLDAQLEAARKRKAELKKKQELRRLKQKTERLERRLKLESKDINTVDPLANFNRDDRETFPADPNYPLNNKEKDKKYGDIGEYRRIRNRDLKPKNLPNYFKKSVLEYINFFQAANLAFDLAPHKFKREHTQVAYIMQFLKGDPRKQWFRYIGTGKTLTSSPKEKLRRATDKFTWYIYTYFKKFLLNLVEYPKNRLRIAAQVYNDTKQRQDQTVRQFAVYLSDLKAQLPPYTKA